MADKSLKINSKRNFDENDLSQYVRQCLYDAHNHRVNCGVDGRIDRNLRLREGEYDPEECARFGAMAPYLNVVEVKCHDFEAAFTDVQFSIAKKPFTITPSPNPRISAKAKREAALRVIEDIQGVLQATGNVSPDQVLQLIINQKGILEKEVKTLAKRGVKKVETAVYDNLAESDWINVYAKFVQDLSIFPTAFVKGPVIVHKQKQQWLRNMTVKDDVPQVEFFRVDPRYIFPSADSETTQDGQYLVEVAPISSKELSLLLKDDNYRKTEIKELLDELYGDDSRYYWWTDATFKDHLTEHSAYFYNILTTAMLPSTCTYVLKFYGTLLGSQVKTLGIKGEHDDYEYYEIEAWVVGDRVIKLVDRDGEPRPINGTSFRTVPTSIWGESIADLLEDIQKSINAMDRAGHENAQWVTEPVKEIYDKMFPIGDIPEDIRPNDEFHIKSDPYQSDTRGVHFHNGRSAITELFNTLMLFYRLADDLVGIQSQVTGAANQASVNRTASVYVASANNALKKIKLVGKNIDRHVIVPIINALAVRQLEYNAADLYRSDIQVIASGTAGIVEKEVMSQQIGIILQTITTMLPFDDPENPRAKELFYSVFRQFLESHGFDPGRMLPNPEEKNDIMTSTQTAGEALQSAPENSQPATAQPVLDNRSVELVE